MDTRAFLRPLSPLPGLVMVGVALHLGVPAVILAAVVVAAIALTISLYRKTA
jgi:Flp pilus assembly protein TadB